MIKELVEYLVKQLVDEPEQVGVSVSKDGTQHILEVKVADRDRGKVIGKQGQTIKAIRTLVSVIIPEGKKVTINIVE